MAGRFARWWALRGNLLAGVERFPVPLLSLACFVVLINLDIAGAIDLVNIDIVRAGAASGAATALSTAITLLGERRRLGPPVRHGAGLLLGAIAALAIWTWERLGVAPPALLGAAVLTVPLAPYLRVGLPGFWAFIWSLIHAGALAFIAVIIFCLGLSAILVSMTYLFGLTVDGTVYGHVWSIGLGFVGPLFALSLVPAEFPADDRPDGADIVISGVRLLSDFVAVPLLATYALILHAYAAKILLSGELPNNQIGWMVLSFGLCVLALRIVVHPLRETARVQTRLFLRWWAVPLVVPLALLVTAVWLRMAAYGVTPERYGLALFALFLGLVLLAQVPRRLRGDIRVIPALGAVCLFIASFGAWGILSASATSQTGRLLAYLEAAGALEDGRLSAVPQVEAAAASDIQSILWLLDDIGQLDRLRPLFAGRPNDPFAASAGPTGANSSLEAAVHSAFGLDRVPAALPPDGAFWLDSGNAGAVPIGGFDLTVPGLTWNGVPATITPAGAGLAIVIEARSDGVAIVAGAERVAIAPDELREAILARAVDVQRSPMLPPFFIEFSAGGRRIGLLIQAIGGVAGPTELRIDSGRFSLFLRRADWPG